MLLRYSSDWDTDESTNAEAVPKAYYELAVRKSRVIMLVIKATKGHWRSHVTQLQMSE